MQRLKRWWRYWDTAAGASVDDAVRDLYGNRIGLVANVALAIVAAIISRSLTHNGGGVLEALSFVLGLFIVLGGWALIRHVFYTPVRRDSERSAKIKTLSNSNERLMEEVNDLRNPHF